MFAKRLGMRTIARSPSGFVTCNIHTRARVKERVRESHERKSEREREKISHPRRLRSSRGKTRYKCTPTSITFPPFTSSTLHTTSPSFSLISTSRSWTCARTCFRLALIYLCVCRARKQAHIGVFSRLVFSHVGPPEMPKLRHIFEIPSTHLRNKHHAHSRAKFDRFRYRHVTHKR